MSSLRSLSSSDLAILISIAATGLFVLRLLLHKFGIKLPENAATWKSYLKGQGMILFVFLLLGGTAAFSSWKTISVEQSLEGGKLIEYRNLNASEHPVYENLDVENYSEVTILAKASDPEHSTATLTIYSDDGNDTSDKIKRMECVSGSWTRWEHKNSTKHLRLIVQSSPLEGLPAPTNIDVLIYLTPEHGTSH